MDDTSAKAEHRNEAGNKMSPLGRKLFKYVEFDENEKLIAEIRKHEIGVLGIGLVGVFIALIMLTGGAFVAANLQNLGLDTIESPNSVKAIIASASLLLAIAAIAVAFIGIILYRLNVVFITNEKIAQVNYVGIFNRRVTQLNIGKVEDVTVTQKGIFAYIFGYGTLLVETAGEQENPSFTLVPQPNLHSQQIVDAHAKYVELYGN